MTNSSKVDEQINLFYDQRRNITHADQVQYVITTDIFSKRMDLAQTVRDKTVTVQQKDFLQQVNGNVVWGKTNKDALTVMIASKVFQYDDYTWRGTVHHEYTHAHDFCDLADYLGITNMDDIYDYQHYYPFHLWSEYHARKAGFTNVCRHVYRSYPTAEMRNICNVMFRDICKSLMGNISAYDAMQMFGRYSALRELYGSLMLPLQIGHKKHSLPQEIINVGRFLHSHPDFNLVRNNFDQFQALLNAVSI